MANQRHDASVPDSGAQSQRTGATTNRRTSAPRDSIAEIPIHHEDSVTPGDRTDAGGSTADEVVVRMTALYAVRRDDGIWFTECAWCKRVRNVTGDWQALALSDRSAIHAERTHGICPECADRCLAQAAEP